MNLDPAIAGQTAALCVSFSPHKFPSGNIPDTMTDDTTQETPHEEPKRRKRRKHVDAEPAPKADEPPAWGYERKPATPKHVTCIVPTSSPSLGGRGRA